MTDRERILTYIIKELSSTEIHRNYRIGSWTSEAFRKAKGWGEGFHPHCAPWKKFDKGDLVICETSGIHNGTVGVVLEVLAYDEALILGVGDDKCIRIHNDSFVPILGIDLTQEIFLCGEAREFYIKVKKAFKRGGEYLYRYDGIKIRGNNAIISIRFDQGKKKLFEVEMWFFKNTTIRKILATLIDGGYGSYWD